MNQRSRLWEMIPPWKLAGEETTATVLLGLSGGADSGALLHLLSHFAKRDGFSVVTAHVHHGIRGEEADRDADFCRRLAESYGWECLQLHADVPALAAAHKRSLELEAREVRYAFFQQVMQERKIPILVTAHHADDNLETVLFRLCRGTGLHGLGGIPTVRKMAFGTLVRPLLPYSKSEILDFCRQEALEYVTDSTNALGDCSRNRIRLEIVPRLEEQFAGVQGSVYRMTRTLADDQNYLEREADRFWQTNASQGGISAEILQLAHSAIRRRVIGKMLPKTLEAVHLEAVEDLLEKGNSGSSVSLPGDWCACLQNGRLVMLPDLRRREGYDPFPCREGNTLVCDGKLMVSVKTYEKCESTSNVHNAYTSLCIIKKGFKKEGLYFRARRSGDTMLRHGVSRQIRRLYREAGVPLAVRDALPLLCDGDSILWAPFVGFADGVAVGDGDEGDWQIAVLIQTIEETK